MKKIIAFCLCLGWFALPVLAQDILTAVKNGDLEQVKSFLKQDPELIRTKDEYRNSLLRIALLRNDFSMARFLIESGIDVNYGREDTGGGNELFSAIESGSLEITKLIYEKGADINFKNNWGATPLTNAIYEGNREIVDFLMDKGAVLSVDERNLPGLMRAALRGGIDRITKLLMKEKNVDYRNVDDLGDTFLHAIAQSGGTTFVNLLIEKGLDPNARNVFGWTPLHYAALYGHRKMIEALLQKGADKNVRTKDGKTFFNIAEGLGPKDIVPYLKEKGLDTAPAEFPKLDAKYIDPNLPGQKPVRFAPGIISQPHHFEHSIFSFTVDMKTACWADWQRTGISKIFVMENKSGSWQAPRTVHLRATNPCIAPDGKRIYFTAPRILADGKDAADNDIFYIQKTEKGWSNRINLGPNVNTEGDDSQPVVTRDGTVYFCHNADIYRSRLVDGRYAPKEKLPTPINSESTQAEPYIAPDESFLLFRSIGQGGMAEPNYYFSSRNADGSWTEPVNIAKKVKDEGPFPIGLFPSLTPDRRYMIYFLGGDYYWLNISAVMNELIKPASATGEQIDLAAPSGPGGSRETFYGQPAPGTEPVKFVPEILTSEKHPHGQLAFSPDGTGVFWSAMPKDGPEQTIFYSAFDGKAFSRPVVAPFAAASGYGGPAFSADGKRLFFNAELPPASRTSAGREAICYVDKTASGWSRPVPIESTVDDRMTKGQVSVARNGNIYFTGRVFTEGTPGIYTCRFSAGRYAPPERLSVPVADIPLLDPWIEPDEKFLLVSLPSPEGPSKPFDIGIVLRQPDGTWGKPVRLGGAVNTEAAERFPLLTRDGRYLFFIRSYSPGFVGDQAHFYWVDAKVLEGLGQKARVE
jgi:ankyrin repeat protein